MPSFTAGMPASVPTGCPRQGGSVVPLDAAHDGCRTGSRGRRDRGRSENVGRVGRARLDVPERRLAVVRGEDDASLGVEVGAAVDRMMRRELPRHGRGRGRKAGRRIVGVDDDGSARTLMADDRLLRGAVAGEAPVQLQVIGPERDHRGDRRARGHEGEVRARQLEEEHALRARRLVGTEPVEELGGRPEIAGARAATHRMLDARAPEDLCRERRRRGLAGGPGDPDARPPPALEQQVAEARHPRPLSTETPHPGRDLGRPDVEVGDVGVALDARRGRLPARCSRPSSCSESTSAVAGARLARRTELPSAASSRASAISSRPKPSIRMSTG